MEHTALYRKYRPEAFDALIGQDHIRGAIEGALKKGSPAHAYLFSGGRGTGKTTTARIVARSLGTTDNDIYEIDAASNTGVDNIRELRENVDTLPFDSEYKVYIIDEVHMLSKSAFNALLKTLEEPPKHVVFILATTELDKVPDTVVSRCQSFVFKRPTEAVLREVITNTAKKEGLKLDDGVADLIATLADGSFRDALGLLQKVITSTEGTITREAVESVTGAPPQVLVHDVIDALSRGALPEALKVLAQAQEQNLQAKTFLGLIIHTLRRILLVKVAPSITKEEITLLSKDEQEFIVTLAKGKSPHISSKTLLTFLDAVGKQKVAFVEYLPLELALIEILGEDSE